jgi:hypothetical protein
MNETRSPRGLRRRVRIHLVVDTVGSNEMMIADNQRDTDAPHSRFASRKGKTPTEYFLRAQ